MQQQRCRVHADTEGAAKTQFVGVDTGARKREMCMELRLDGMMDLARKVCQHRGCTNRASFGLHGGTNKRMACTDHKTGEMVRYKQMKKCVHRGCSMLPCVARPGAMRGKRCSIHKFDGMIDAVHKGCGHPGCSTLPCVARPGAMRGERCSTHKAGLNGRRSQQGLRPSGGQRKLIFA